MRAALTFEAGGDPAPAVAMLDALAAHDIRATFFVDGRWAERHGPLVKALATAGHQLGNHGFAHPDWTTLADDEVRADLRATEQLVERLAGQPVKPWARPPYGALDDRVLRVLAQEGYRAFYRDAVDGVHWPGKTTPASVVARAVRSIEDGATAVLHTSSPDSAAALANLIAALRARGVELVVLSELEPAPTARLERHSDFDALELHPGYTRPRAPGGRWQLTNVIERATGRWSPPGRTELVATLDGVSCEALTGDAQETVLAATPGDRYALVLAGGLRCARPDGELTARTGDLFLCPSGLESRLRGLDQRRYCVLLWSAR